MFSIYVPKKVAYIYHDSWHDIQVAAPWSTITKHTNTQKVSNSGLQTFHLVRLSVDVIFGLASSSSLRLDRTKWGKVNIFNQCVKYSYVNIHARKTRNNNFKILKSMKHVFCKLLLPGNNNPGHKRQQIKILLPLIWFYHIFFISTFDLKESSFHHAGAGTGYEKLFSSDEK